MRCCGDCHNHDADGQLCRLGLSYAAFVRADAPANGCVGFVDKERAQAEKQSECRGAGILTTWTQLRDGIKP